MLPLLVVGLAAIAACAPGADDASSSALTEPGAFTAFPQASFGGPKRIALWTAPVARASPAEVLLIPEPEQMGRVLNFPATRDGEASKTLRISGLLPDTTYDYTVTIQGTTSTTASGSFKTSPKKGAHVRATFAVVSCMNVELFPHQVAWTRLADAKPDLLIQLGDNTYAGGNRPERARAWHYKQRAVPEYRRVLERTPVLAIWDDHDFAGNESDGTAEDKDDSLAFFRELFPNPNAGLPDVPGIFFAVDYGDVDIFMLDVRYNRSSFSEPIESRTLLGDAQLAWLESRLRSSRAAFKLIGTGSTIGHGDAWIEYPQDLRRLFALTLEVPGIVILSGDLHRSLFFEWPKDNGFAPTGYTVPEITSSGVAVTAPLFSFATIAVDTFKRDPELVAVVHRVDADGVEREREERLIHRSDLQP